MHIEFKLWYNADDLNVNEILNDDETNDIEANLDTNSTSPFPWPSMDWVYDDV